MKKGLWGILWSMIVAVIGYLAYGYFTTMGTDLYNGKLQPFTFKPTTVKTDSNIKDIEDFKYVDSDEINYPDERKDFASFTPLNEEYSGVYPKDFFKTVSYTEENSRYTFETADKTVKLEYYQEDAAKYEEAAKSEYPHIDEKPLALATYLFEQDKKKLINFTEDDLHISKTLPESRLARCLVPGNSKKNSEVAYFICRVCSDDTVYTLRVKYYLGKDIKQNEKTPINYLCESLYREWSISGSSYTIRSYDHYCRDIN